MTERFSLFKKSYESQDYLQAAISTEKWLQTAELTYDYGTTWLCCPENPGANIPNFPNRNGFYSGTAGIIFFYLALYEATKNNNYLEKAKLAGDYIINTYTETMEEKKMILADKVKHSEWNMYSGASGEGCSLIYLSEESGSDKYSNFALKIADDILDAAIPTEKGVIWTGETGPLLDGGIMLYLLFVYKHIGGKKYLEAATKAAYQIESKSTPDPRGGIRWQGMSPELVNKPSDTYWPNFEYGTAGIGFLMAIMYEETKENLFLQSALNAAEHIRSIAKVENNSARVYFSEPNETDLYYLGNCHGPVGDAKLFYKLYQITGDIEHKQWVEMFANGILESGAPHVHSPGYWVTQCHCCGEAGMLEFFIALWAEYGDKKYLDLAEETARCLIGNSTNSDNKGLKWYQAWSRLDPSNFEAYIGYSVGAAGNATALIELYLAKENKFHAFRFLDDPYPNKVKSSK